MKNSINKKHSLFAEVIKSGYDPTKVAQYRRYRNILTKILRTTKKDYYASLFVKNCNNSKTTWNIVNELLCTHKRKPNIRLPDHLTIDTDNAMSVNYNNPQEIVNGFNEFFTNIGPRLASKIELSGKSYMDFLSQPSDYSFFLFPTTDCEVVNLLRGLDIQKAAGYDNISAKLLVNAAEYIAGPLCHIFNLSFVNCKFPDALKVAKVVPIFKKGAKENPANYRPISVLPLISKILEKAVNNRLVNYFNKHDLFYKHQYGFRKRHSAKLSLINLLSRLTSQIDQGNSTIGIFLDFSKAFDTIEHKILIAKLLHYGVRGNPLLWFADYLNQRYQYVSVDSLNSVKLPVVCGVPQGSILGPTLFLIYINDLPNSSDFFDFRLFADDSNLFHTYPNDINCIDLSLVEDHLRNVTCWCDSNRLTINISKTNYVLFQQKRRAVYAYGDLCLKNQPLVRSHQASFVGVIIDEHLTWKPHITEVNSVIRKKAGMLFRLRYFVPQRILILLYTSFIQPHVTYGLEVWGNTYPTYLNSICITQKMCMRSMTFSEYREPSSPLFYKLGILDIFKLYKLLVCTFIFDLLHQNVSHDLSDYFHIVDHEYNTRQKLDKNLTLPRMFTSAGQSSISYTGVKIWNALPNHIKNQTSRTKFTKAMKDHLLLEYRALYPQTQ